MRPGFLVIGAQKCATSTLCDLLAMQDGVFICAPKEPHFFSDERVWARGMAWYESLFAGAAGARAAGEGSTTYTMRGLYPQAAPRIAQALPGVKVIYIVRHPLRRIESHWLHLRVHGSLDGGPETRDFATVVRTRPELIDNTLYHEQLAVYRELFGDARVLVLFYEDLFADTPAVLRRCLDFLGLADVSPRLPDGEVRNNVSADKRPDNRLGHWLRRVPWLHRWRARLPRGLRAMLRWLVKGRPDARPAWDDALHAFVMARIADDTRAFLRDAGKPADFWNLSREPRR